MAVVVKSESDERETSRGDSELTNYPSIIIESDKINPLTGERELLEVCETSSGGLSNAVKQARASQVFNRREQVHGGISSEELESISSRFVDDEVIGIITMEDVLEELLQVRFLKSAIHLCACVGLAVRVKFGTKGPEFKSSAIFKFPVNA